MPCNEEGTKLIRSILHLASSILAILEHPFWGYLSGGAVARGKIFTASIDSVDAFYPSYIYIYIYCAKVMGSNLARGKIFTASIGSVDSLYPSVITYCLNLHQSMILCSSKAMMFVKIYFCTSDIYLISLVSLDPSGFHLRTK